MLFASLLLTNLFFISSVLSAPSGRLATRLQRRAEDRQSDPLQPISPSSGFQAPQSNGTEHIQYTTNWAGAVWEKPANTWKTVTGTFVVPTPKLNHGQTWASASAWVGIDSDSCGSAILRTGIDFTNNKGHVSYDAWYEWWPDFAHDFTGFKISKGDTITLTVTAYTRTSGIAIVYNHNTKKTVSKTLSAQPALCEKDAEWIVEDYQLGGSLVPLANWGKVHFTKASATSHTGKNYGPKGAGIAAIVSNGKVVTKTTTGDSTVDVSFIG